MTSVIMIAPLNAENFESGAATDGQVLTADGAGGAAWEDAAGGVSSVLPTGSLIVSGMHPENKMNGVYLISGQSAGRPTYARVSGAAMIVWDSGWYISSEPYQYFSADDVATPDLVTTWVVLAGSLPLPIVTAGDNYPEGHMLIADGAGDMEWQEFTISSVDPRTMVTVSGAGTAINDNYYPIRELEGGRFYYDNYAGTCITFDFLFLPPDVFGYYWMFQHIESGEIYYRSAEEYALHPDLVSAWIEVNGVLPAPTLTPIPADCSSGTPLVADGYGGAVFGKLNPTQIKPSAAPGNVLQILNNGTVGFHRPWMPYAPGIGSFLNPTSAQFDSAYPYSTDREAVLGDIAYFIDEGNGNQYTLIIRGPSKWQLLPLGASFP